MFRLKRYNDSEKQANARFQDSCRMRAAVDEAAAPAPGTSL